MLLDDIFQLPVGVLHGLYRVLQRRQLNHLALGHGEPAEDSGKLIRGSQNGSLDPQTGKVIFFLGILQILWSPLEWPRVHELSDLVDFVVVENLLVDNLPGQSPRHLEDRLHLADLEELADTISFRGGGRRQAHHELGGGKLVQEPGLEVRQPLEAAAPVDKHLVFEKSWK